MISSAIMAVEYRRACFVAAWLVTWHLDGAAQAQEFTPLFNTRDLSGWVEMGEPGGFVVDDGMLVLKSPRNHPNWLRTSREFENFDLRLEYLMPGWCETGVFIHAPLYGDREASGVRVHLKHDRSEQGSRSTGGIYDVAAPISIANRPAKEWNTLEIEADWPMLRVRLNGVLVQDINREFSPAMRAKARRGYIGLDDLNCAIRYRRIEIRERPDTATPWKKLSNGKDLTGWRVEGKVPWTVENGAFVARDGDGYLFTEEAFRAFELEVYFRTTQSANGGVFYRAADGHRGYEVQIYNVPGATNPTGSIYGHVGASDVRCRDNEWCQMRIVSDGAYTGVWINGHHVAESYRLELPDEGRIGFQMHSAGQIEYVDPRIRSLR
jgi:hypothetical protein